MTYDERTSDVTPSCPACHAPLPQDAALCPSCGWHLNQRDAATGATDRLPPLIHIPVRVCRQCGLVNIPERRSCKHCHANLPQITHRYERQPPSQRMELPPWALLLIAGGLIAIVIYTRFYPAPPEISPSSLQATISRANRVIAIDDPDVPSYRWVITTPEDYTVFGDTGIRAEHQPAQIWYTTMWANASSNRNSSRGTNLSEAEWQQVAHWQQTWCRDQATHQDPAHERSIYIVAMRCTGYAATIFRVPKIAMPVEITRLLQRAAQ